MKSLLKIMGYVSLAVAVLGLIFVTESWIGYIPFLVNTYLAFRFIEGNFSNKEAMVAYTGIMMVLNLLVPEGAFVDVLIWGLSMVAWYKAEN